MRHKYLDFAKFYVLQDRIGQKSQVWAKFLTWLNFFDFTQFYGLQDKVGQKSQIWTKFPKLLKFLDFAKFHGLQGGQKSQIRVKL